MSDPSIRVRVIPAVAHRDPEIMAGTPVFVGTRVPVSTLFDYLKGGETLATFLQHFPGVSHEQAIWALEGAKIGYIARVDQFEDDGEDFTG